MDPGAAAASNDKESMVDPFLVEALQNPRHRLTILRMELDIRKFMQNSGQQPFEFQHFPTSYLRLAAHRVAQHYGLQTMVQDGGLDGSGNRILVIKTAGSRLPAVRLSDIPAKQFEDDKTEQIKIVIRPRPSKASANEADDAGTKKSPVRSVEERKEEYDRARARIFSSPSGSDSDDTFSQTSTDQRNISLNRDDNEVFRIPVVDIDRNTGIRDGSTQSRVAILKDREKDRSDPDYDRSYERYVRSVPAGQIFGLLPFNVQKIQHPFGHFDAGFTPLGPMPRSQASLNYMPPSGAVMNSFGVTGLNQNTSDTGYMQWPTAAMMYAHSYEQLRQGVFQAPVCQQPLSFDYSQNH